LCDISDVSIVICLVSVTCCVFLMYNSLYSNDNQNACILKIEGPNVKKQEF